MSYNVVGQQILQTGIPSSKTNLIASTEVSVASLAESIMLGVAIIANDTSHFGFLAMLSLLSVVGAAAIFCQWLLNPTDEQRKLFSFSSQFEVSEKCPAKTIETLTRLCQFKILNIYQKQREVVSLP